MQDLNLFLLLFGSPSIIVLFSFVVVHTWENAKTSNHNWSAEDQEPVLKEVLSYASKPSLSWPVPEIGQPSRDERAA